MIHILVTGTQIQARKYAAERKISLWLWPRGIADLPPAGSAHVYLAPNWAEHPEASVMADYFTECIGGSFPLQALRNRVVRA